MSRRVVFRPQAEDERWRSTGVRISSRGLGWRVARAVDGLVARMADNPVAFPRVHGETRRAVLSRFPYAIYFRVDAEDVVVLTRSNRRLQPTALGASMKRRG